MPCASVTKKQVAQTTQAKPVPVVVPEVEHDDKTDPLLVAVLTLRREGVDPTPEQIEILAKQGRLTIVTRDIEYEVVLNKHTHILSSDELFAYNESDK